jgi:hypothetical protein
MKWNGNCYEGIQKMVVDQMFKILLMAQTFQLQNCDMELRLKGLTK